MNDWIIGQAVPNKPLPTPFHLPMSASDINKDPALEAQVHQVLLNTATSLTKGNQPAGFFRGQKEVGLNSFTILEYLHGILYMNKDQAVPSNMKPYLYAHLEELIEDARDFDWATAVQPWSEEIFTLVAEGHLPEGWASHSKIQMLRMTMSRASKLGLILLNLPLLPPKRNLVPCLSHLTI